MGPERYIFEVAIYRQAEDAFWSEYRSALEAHLAEMRRLVGVAPGLAPESERQEEQHFWDEYVAPWRYNQAIGWVRLFVLGDQLRGDLWMVEAKRYSRRMLLKKFRYRGKAFEILTSSEENNIQLSDRLRDQLTRLTRKFGSRKFAVDLEAFDNLSVYINWRTLLGYVDDDLFA